MTPRDLRFVVPILTVTLAGCGGDRHSKTIHASGHIEATEVRLAAKVGGRLLELPLREGDRVAAGQLVARLESTDAEHDLARARAELAGAEAQLRLLLAGSRKEDIRQASEQLAGAQAELDAANRDLDRLEGLAERGTATVKARDDARTRREVATRSLRAQSATLAKLQAGARPEEIDAARAKKSIAEAVIATIEQRIADATLLSPRDGVITSRAAEPGEMLAPGSILEVLTDIDHPWLEVFVDEPSLASIRLGDPVSVRVDGHEGDLTGRVSYISPVAEFTPKNVQTPEERAKLVFKVKLALDNGEGILKPGMPADAYFAPAPRGALPDERR